MWPGWEIQARADSRTRSVPGLDRRRRRSAPATGSPLRASARIPRLLALGAPPLEHEGLEGGEQDERGIGVDVHRDERARELSKQEDEREAGKQVERVEQHGQADPFQEAPERRPQSG